MSKSVAVIVGVGEGNGAALARAFSRENMAVALLARRTDFTRKLAEELPDARAYACDVADSASVAEVFDRIRGELGDPNTVIYNAGSGVWGDVESIDLEGFESSWRVNAYGALAVSQQVIPAMKAAGRSPTCCSAITTRTASCRSRIRGIPATFRLTTLHGSRA